MSYDITNDESMHNPYKLSKLDYVSTEKSVTLRVLLNNFNCNDITTTIKK